MTSLRDLLSLTKDKGEIINSDKYEQIKSLRKQYIFSACISLVILFGLVGVSGSHHLLQIILLLSFISTIITFYSYYNVGKMIIKSDIVKEVKRVDKDIIN